MILFQLLKVKSAALCLARSDADFLVRFIVLIYPSRNGHRIQYQVSNGDGSAHVNILKKQQSRVAPGSRQSESRKTFTTFKFLTRQYYTLPSRLLNCFEASTSQTPAVAGSWDHRLKAFHSQVQKVHFSKRNV